MNSVYSGEFNGHFNLNIFQHGAVLGRERGFITCKADGQAERRFPLDDIRAVIIAARGVTISSNFLSGLLETDAIVLHCDERHQACGWRFLRVFASLR
jgi:CRISPR-associated protein Cas1